MRLRSRVCFHGLSWLLLITLVPVQQAAAQMAGISPEVIGLPIDKILISGNEDTQERWVLKWTDLSPGQVISIPLLKRARQELLDTDLFRTVGFQAERFEDGELTLHILLEERKSWLLLPRLNRNADGDVKTGIRLRMYNLRGADQTLEALVQREEEHTGDDSEEFRIYYKLPLFAKPYDLEWRLSQVVENTEVEDFDNIETIDRITMSVSRDWHIEGLSLPLTVGTGITVEELGLDRPYPESIEAREAGQYNRLHLQLILDDLHSERYRRYGSYYSITVARGFEWLDSDYESNIFEFEALGFRPLNRYDNINYRLNVAVSNDSPFDYLNYSIGGGSSIRGLESFDDRGDARFFINLEYVFAYKKHPGMQHSLFLDFGNVYDDFDDIDLSDLRYTVGTGFRWKIESFVKTDLFLDFGYDIEAKTGKLYGGTSLPF